MAKPTRVQPPTDLPIVEVLAIQAIVPAAQNPRTDAERDLSGLIASLASEQEPYLVQAPLVERRADHYLLISGERRVRAALAAGWQQIACVVMPAQDPKHAHTMRLLENLHRQELHPLDTAIALKIAWLSENCVALEATDAVQTLLHAEQAPYATLQALEQLAATLGFTPTKPRISWQTLLTRLGLGINKERLKKLLRVLALSPEVLECVRPLHVSEASLRALGTLEEGDQLILAHAIQGDTHLQSRIRRIARRVKQKGYPIAKAIAEAQGRVYDPHATQAKTLDADDLINELDQPAAMEAEAYGGARETALLEPAIAEAVLRLLDLAEHVRSTQAVLRGHGQPLEPPWSELWEEAQELLKQAIV